MRALFLLPLLLVGCAQTARVPDGPPETLAEAQALWADADLDAYRMTLSRSCFCPPEYRGPYEVVVEEGRVQTVVYEGEGVPDDRALTVEALFDLLNEAYEQKAARIDVTYHPALGYPTSLYIDYSEQMADEEVGYTVAELRAP